MCAETLWYVAYGSNLSAGRLQRYLDQTSPVAAPLDRRPMVLEHRLFFAEWSVGWGGGCAFIDPRPSSGVETRVTAWRLRADQFLGILARENGGAAVPDDFAPEAVGVGDRCMVVDGRYGLVMGCPSPDGRPSLTFTTPADPLPTESAPSASYLATIADGLIADHGLTPSEAKAYLSARSI